MNLQKKERKNGAPIHLPTDRSIDVVEHPMEYVPSLSAEPNNVDGQAKDNEEVDGMITWCT
jgi:hypothetical protein